MIEVEQVSLGQLDEWLDLRNRIHPDDPLELFMLVARRERDLDHVDLLARLDGVAAGIGAYGRMIDDPVSRIGRVNFRVLPEHRRRGVATALHRAASMLGRPHGDVELEGQVVAPTAEAEAYIAARGYRVVPTREVVTYRGPLL